MLPIPPVQPGQDRIEDVPDETIERLRQRLQYGLPRALSLRLVSVHHGELVLEMTVAEQHLAVNGFLHAGSVVTLADTSCGFGCFAHLPAGAENFTTIELKSNFISTATSGVVRSRARLQHSGRTTQVWDAVVEAVDERTERAEARVIALFRCTQMILYPRT